MRFSKGALIGADSPKPRAMIGAAISIATINDTAMMPIAIHLPECLPKAILSKPFREALAVDLLTIPLYIVSFPAVWTPVHQRTDQYHFCSIPLI